MGQGQSSDSGSATGGAQDVKTSYYILLGIERTATEDEIKKAYRRKALELHPDRNYGREEEATKTFAEIQAAYEVLSDPQERAWYDSHESAILRGDDAADAEGPVYENVRVTTADDLARLLRKFNSSVEFTDSPSGFFGFIRETFEQLAKEEEIAANWENVDVLQYPSFGHKDDTYNDVVKQFYSAWSAFSTVKTFSWKDKYRLSEAPDRWYRRRMEQENSRLRKEGKQEFNEAVRALVAFVKKRDPRFIPNTQSEAERQQTLRDAAAAQAARARAANAAKISTEEIPEWTKVRDPEDLDESEEEEVEQEVLECVACNKTFKSEKQWEAHEKSKKHQKAVKSLQNQMRKQNIKLDLEDDGITTAEIKEISDDEVMDEYEIIEANGEIQDDVDSQDFDKETDEDEDRSPIINNDSVNEQANDNEVPQKQAETPSEAIVESDEASTSENEDYASRETVQARMQSISLNSPSSGVSEDDSAPSKPKMGKAAQKRAKKAAAAALDQQAEASHKCQVCNAEFPSRTKLFAHVEREGHAALKSATSGNGTKGKKKKSKK